MAKDPIDRQAGVYALGKRILDNKIFQAQTPENKQNILKQYYKSYVEPAYEFSNLQPPDENTWVKGMSIPGGPTMRVDDFYLNRVNPDQVSDFKGMMMSLGAGFVRAAANIIRGPVIAGMKVDTKMLGLQPYFNDTGVDKFMAADNVPGLVEKGNLPIWNRPLVQNVDGTHSSEYSVSFNQEGNEVLVPTVVDGRFLTPDGKKPKEGSDAEKEMFKTAWGHYLATGEHLGKFKGKDDEESVKFANDYSNILHNRGERPDPDSWKAHYVKLLNKEANSGIMKASQDTISNVDFWFACRPSQPFSEKAGSFVGEQLAQLPLYQSIGLLGKAGLTAVKANKLLEASSATGALVQTANLTRRLATSPLGRQVGKHLAQAAEGYIGSAVQGESSTDAKMDAISFAALGIIGADVGTVFHQFGQRPLENAAKKFFAQQAAVGGLPLIHANLDQAIHDLNNRVIGKDPSGKPIVAPPDASPANVQTMLDVSKAADGIDHGQRTVTKGIFIKTARDMFGEGTQWNKLSFDQRNQVRAKVEMLATAAPQEVSLHNEGLARHEAEKGLEKSMEMSPEIQETLKQIQQQFPSMDFMANVVKSSQDGVKADAGVVTSQKTAQQVTDSAQAIDTAKKASGKRAGPRTREDEVFSDFSDFGVFKYNHGDESFNVQFASKADRALYMVHKNPAHPVSEKVKKFFPDMTPNEIKAMAEEVKDKVSDLVKGRIAHPDYKSGKMKYGVNVRIPSIHGGSKKEEEQDLKEEIEEFSKAGQAAKNNNPEVYNASLTALAQMQALKQAAESSK